MHLCMCVCVWGGGGTPNSSLRPTSEAGQVRRVAVWSIMVGEERGGKGA